MFVINKLYLAKVTLYDGHDYSSYVTVTNIITNLDKDNFMNEFKEQLIVAKDYVDNRGKYDSKNKPKYADIFFYNASYSKPSVDDILKNTTFTEVKSGYNDTESYGHWE